MTFLILVIAVVVGSLLAHYFPLKITKKLTQMVRESFVEVVNERK
jgi:hypothetical protein